MSERTRHEMAVVLFVAVDAVDFTDAAFVAELAVKQAIRDAQPPGMEKWWIRAEWPHMSVPVWVARVVELNAARDMLVTTPTASVFERGE